MKLRAAVLSAFALPLVIAAAASAVIIDSGDGTGNTSAPGTDPGWGNVGSCNGLSAVYLGNGWVLTASHVGAGNSTFENVSYPWQVGSAVQLHNPDDSLADLVVFRLQPPFPPLPALEIVSAAPASNASLVLIGNGHDRGAATTWNPPGPGTYDGYLWGAGVTKRWGTNRVESATHFESGFGTWVFGTLFQESGGGHTTHEAQGAVGDSGGAAFVWTGADYDLAGILIGIATHRVLYSGTYYDQPPETALYGNATYAADLSVYRDEIVALPEPSGWGLVAGAILLAVWTSAGTRRACRGTGSAASSPRRA